MRCYTAALATLVAVLAVAAGPALAHHPMGGAVPDTLWQGLLSGIGHPIIGVDHFAFVVAVGVLSAFAARRLELPVIFALATVAGCFLHVSGAALPATELVVTLSVVALGLVVMAGWRPKRIAGALLLAGAGVFHGSAYGGAIIGSEAAPLATYLVGFAMTQATIAISVAWVVTSVWRVTDPASLRPRLAGAMVAGIGLALLVEAIEGAVFA